MVLLVTFVTTCLPFVLCQPHRPVSHLQTYRQTLSKAWVSCELGFVLITIHQGTKGILLVTTLGFSSLGFGELLLMNIITTTFVIYWPS